MFTMIDANNDAMLLNVCSRIQQMMTLSWWVLMQTRTVTSGNAWIRWYRGVNVTQRLVAEPGDSWN